ncbi:MAG: hypothetical protein A2583_16325 [Bdellovibrionales bacterium RIFOXYD1_FULL_53_11]|nr:MAG: hypothetical protein A2583_16325 [Bdellovibrionales bacterium RIFOXYD1_FULL_53_11]
MAQIENGTDPLGRAIAKLFQKGAGGVLYLAISPPPAGSSLPVFLATAMAGENVQPEIWTGMRWDPRVVPDIWNVFVKSGLLELPPPSANTNIKSSRNVVRDAFGIALSDWITLVRTGPANACRGMLGFVSRESIIMAVKDLLPLLNAKMPGK